MSVLSVWMLFKVQITTIGKRLLRKVTVQYCSTQKKHMPNTVNTCTVSTNFTFDLSCTVIYSEQKICRIFCDWLIVISCSILSCCRSFAREAEITNITCHRYLWNIHVAYVWQILMILHVKAQQWKNIQKFWIAWQFHLAWHTILIHVSLAISLTMQKLHCKFRWFDDDMANSIACMFGNRLLWLNSFYREAVDIHLSMWHRSNNNVLYNRMYGALKGPK